MLEVVATTPSSPLEAGVAVTLDMVPRLRELMNAGYASEKTAIAQPSFIRESTGSVQAATWPDAHTKRILKRLLPTAKARVLSRRIPKRYGEIHEEETPDFCIDSCRGSPASAGRR